MVTPAEVRRLFLGQVDELSLRKDADGNHINRSSHRVFARRWRLGIFPLAQGLGFLGLGRYRRAVVQGAASFLERRTTNGNSIYRRFGRLALAGLAGFNQADGGMCTKPACTRPACSNIARRGFASEGFVCTSEGLALGGGPAPCGAQMAKARRRGSRLLRPVRCLAFTNARHG
jgi:hypothetical protein